MISLSTPIVKTPQIDKAIPIHYNHVIVWPAKATLHTAYHTECVAISDYAGAAIPFCTAMAMKVRPQHMRQPAIVPIPRSLH